MSTTLNIIAGVLFVFAIICFFGIVLFGVGISCSLKPDPDRAWQIKMNPLNAISLPDELTEEGRSYRRYLIYCIVGFLAAVTLAALFKSLV